MLSWGFGCVGVITHSSRYDYFGTPNPQDAWSPKISGWQRRERSDERLLLEKADLPMSVSADAEETSAPALAGAEGALRSKYFDFRAERRRRTAREFSEWIQSEAKKHYVADGPIDHWATLEETLRGDGDDCDGLELLVYHALRDLGFSSSEVYRSIVYRPSDGQHHMVTLWFEERDDPWVIDPTGAMVVGMRRMSQVPEWVPLKVFSDSTEYSVRRTRALPDSSLAANP